MWFCSARSDSTDSISLAFHAFFMCCTRCHFFVLTIFLVVDSLASRSPVGGRGGSRPWVQAAASLAVLLFFPLALLNWGSWCTSELILDALQVGCWGCPPCCCGMLALACPGCLSKTGESLLQTSPLLLSVVAWIC